MKVNIQLRPVSTCVLYVLVYGGSQIQFAFIKNIAKRGHNCVLLGAATGSPILFSFQLPVCNARPIDIMDIIYIYNMCSYA